ncbi:(2Fe-2S) ferredoxin domain-containing protein [Rickettsiella endosymbiont of Miltochrista miniata]|uniref:(2Fe-2S) ferredoxin domain-containing protein n=1 Tax=Rickettsiella endosymbiont of Miltochrista miniata TaxID=3066239 RepID=UPI00313EAE79
MSYYQQHIFLCTNLRENNKDCCAKRGANPLFDYLKTKIKLLMENQQQRIRVSHSGCLGRCSLGPLLVIYPEDTWYHYETQHDIDEIIEQHLIKKQIVHRLLLPNAK